MSNRIIDEGVNGTGKGIINVNSQDFKNLRKAIEEHAAKQTLEEKMKYRFFSLKIRMEKYAKEENPPRIISSNDFLKEHLKVLGIKNKDFAKFIGLEESNLSAILRGKRKINSDLALKLGLIFLVHPNLWLWIQSKNEILHLKQEKDYTKNTFPLEKLLNKAS